MEEMDNFSDSQSNSDEEDSLKRQKLQENEYFVAIKYAGPQHKSHVIIHFNKICGSFDPRNLNYDKEKSQFIYNNPNGVYVFDKKQQKDISVSAYILAHSKSYEELSNRTKRYVYPKECLRLSGAMEALAEKQTLKENKSEAEDVLQDSEEFDDDAELDDGIKKKRKKPRQKVQKSKSKKEDTAAYKNSQKEILRRKAKELVESGDVQEDQQKMLNAVKINYKLNIDNEVGTIEKPPESIFLLSMQRNKELQKKLKDLQEEHEKLQLSLGLANSTIELLKVELDETYNLLQKCLEKCEKVNPTRVPPKTLFSSPSFDLYGDFEEYVGNNKTLHCTPKSCEKSEATPRKKNVKTTPHYTPSLKGSTSVKRTKRTICISKDEKIDCLESKIAKLDTYQSLCNENDKNINSKTDEAAMPSQNSASFFKKKKSIVDYDTDEYEKELKSLNKTKKVEEFRSFIIKKGDGNIKKMFHLCYGINIPYEKWVKIRQQPTISRFIDHLANALYTERELVLRAIEVQSAQKRPGRDSPRKCVTPKKAGVFRKSHTRYLLVKNQLSNKKVKKLKEVLAAKREVPTSLKRTQSKINTWTTHLSSSINKTHQRESKRKAEMQVDSDLSNLSGDEELSDIVEVNRSSTPVVTEDEDKQD